MEIQNIVTNIEKSILGKTEQINLILSAMLAGGHVLLEDAPGTGKTNLAKALATSFSCQFSRVQFTPDMLPSELVGINFFNPKTSEFTFKQGSLFANIILADEINRATPRTQAGLLESMEEAQITVDGTTHKLPSPYFVIATQNSIEAHGTFPLPEAQLDRFLIKLSLGYPSSKDSINIAKGLHTSQPLAPVCDVDTWFTLQKTSKETFIHDDVYAYIVELSEATRTHEGVAVGASTRAIIALTNMAKAYCFVKGKTFVTPQDVQYLLPYVYGHRLILKGSGRTNATTSILSEISSTVKVPTENFAK